MRICLVVDSADSVFVCNYAKWLKINDKNAIIEIIELLESKTKNGFEIYDNVITLSSRSYGRWGIHFRNQLPWLFRRRAKEKIKGKSYDIIHYHNLLPLSLSIADVVNKHGRRVCATFWGGELEIQRFRGSHRLYMDKLKHFLGNIDCLINSQPFFVKLETIIPLPNSLRLFSATFGAAPMECLNELMAVETKEESKRICQLPADKISVMIGYSGKKLHQHIQIINILKKSAFLKDKIHLVLPFTRDSFEAYTDIVESAAEKSGYSYTFLKNVFLSDSDVARLRNATDIVLQLSTFDGFSRSILECLFAKSVVIYGSWLDYNNYLKDNKCFAIPVESMDECSQVLETIASEPHKYDEETNLNNINIGKKGLWSYCIKDWINCYKTLLDD